MSRQQILSHSEAQGIVYVFLQSAAANIKHRVESF